MGLWDQFQNAHNWNPISPVPGGVMDQFGGGGGGPKAADPYGVSTGQNLFGLVKGGLYGDATSGGYGNLLDLINNPGKTDYYTLNRGLRDTERNTASSMDSSRAQFASRGLGGSGLAAAFQKAIAGAGQNRKQSLLENEARRREELRRSDTDLLRQFVLQPNMQRYAADRGVGLAEDSAKKQQNASYAASAAALIGTLAAAFCHVADELYGYASEPAMLSRYYMAKHADNSTLDLYAHGSKNLAERVKHDPNLRAEVKPIFDHFVEVAKADFPTRFR